MSDQQTVSKETVKALAANVQTLMQNYEAQQESYKKLLRLCLKHLKDPRGWDSPKERAELIRVLAEFTKPKAPE